MSELIIRPWKIGSGDVPHVPFNYLLLSACARFDTAANAVLGATMKIADGASGAVFWTASESWDGGKVSNVTFAPGIGRSSGLFAAPVYGQELDESYCQAGIPDNLWITPEMRVAFACAAPSAPLATLLDLRLVIAFVPPLYLPPRRVAMASPARRKKKRR